MKVETAIHFWMQLFIIIITSVSAYDGGTSSGLAFPPQKNIYIIGQNVWGNDF